MPTHKAVQACGQWLAYCLTIGWKYEELDELERIWWRYHDAYGRLKAASR